MWHESLTRSAPSLQDRPGAQTVASRLCTGQHPRGLEDKEKLQESGHMGPTCPSSKMPPAVFSECLRKDEVHRCPGGKDPTGEPVVTDTIPQTRGDRTPELLVGGEPGRWFRMSGSAALSLTQAPEPRNLAVKWGEPRDGPQRHWESPIGGSCPGAPGTGFSAGTGILESGLSRERRARGSPEPMSGWRPVAMRT